MTRVVVVGSINMDLVTLAARFAGPGETLLGERFVTLQGGKGANQAVAAARSTSRPGSASPAAARTCPTTAPPAGACAAGRAGAARCRGL